MKVLFLDFDGVINSAQFFTMRHRYRTEWKDKPNPYDDDFCPIACSNLLWILEEVNDVRIVVSSSWRLGTSMEELRANLARMGIPPGFVIDKTPDLYKDKHELPRGLEIQKWLDDNQHLGIEKFCIVDDDSDMEHLMNHFVKTHGCTGLDWFAARQIIMMLADPEKVAEWQKVVHAI